MYGNGTVCILCTPHLVAISPSPPYPDFLEHVLSLNEVPGHGLLAGGQGVDPVGHLDQPL